MSSASMSMTRLLHRSNRVGDVSLLGRLFRERVNGRHSQVSILKSRQPYGGRERMAYCSFRGDESLNSLILSHLRGASQSESLELADFQPRSATATPPLMF